jgi:hypothetical protein
MDPKGVPDTNSDRPTGRRSQRQLNSIQLGIVDSTVLLVRGGNGDQPAVKNKSPSKPTSASRLRVLPRGGRQHDPSTESSEPHQTPRALITDTRPLSAILIVATRPEHDGLPSDNAAAHSLRKISI